jgi:glycosyltransferase involved in cell wall biosynthesis
MNILVSIVIPVYNGSQYLEKTLTTILEQDYKRIEVILINDGSTDTSAELINRLAEKDGRISGYHKENGGVAAARNFGIGKASGELIAFCDQDDFWLPNKLSRQLPLFQNEEVGLVYCGAIAEYRHLNKKDKPNFDKQYRGDVFDKLIQVNMFSSCTVVARKNLLQEVQAFDDDRELMGVDDWLAWLKLSLVCELDFVPEHLAIHVFHGDNYSSNEEKMHAAELICLNKIQPIAEKHNKTVDWNEIKQNLHVRYANTYIYNGMFNLAGETLLKASLLKNNGKLSAKGRLFKTVPNFIWRFMQKIKRAV